MAIQRGRLLTLRPGTRLGAYEILQPLGAGGMGEVHRARHLKLEREVALKVLPAAVSGDEARLARFEREARTASALNHPNIVTIYDIAEHDGTTFIAMELVEGRTLRDLIGGGPLPIDQTIGILRQIVEALARAHEAGIVHRDIKPANVMITGDGLVKVLDFGLAKPLVSSEAATNGPTLGETGEGTIVGTPHYMSPEQLSGGALDHRSDQFAVGVLTYEMLAGRPPFDGPSLTAVISAIVAAPTPALSLTRPDVPSDLDRIVSRCLEKDPARRFPDTASLAGALRECEERRRQRARGWRAALRRPAVVAGVALAVAALALGGWFWMRGARARWAEREALDEIAALIDNGHLYDAYRLAREAERYRPGDPALQAVFDRITLPAVVNTEPAGAEVYVKGYGTPDAEWERLGATPLRVRLPYAMTRLRITAEGYEPFEGAPFSAGAIGALARGLVLDRTGTVPEGMVRVPPGVVTSLPVILPDDELPQVQLASYFIDRYEVTNRQFQEFVDAGGYERREWWPMPDDDGTASWEAMIEGFRDRTGRPGPSTWELGRFPAGMEDHPVGGVSWYEAAAVLRVRRQVPADDLSLVSRHRPGAALGHPGPQQHGRQRHRAGRPVRRPRRIRGRYDMAGNVREWVWNAVGGQRYALGGAWNEPTYMFKHLDAADPLGREPVNGLRCAKYVEPPSELLSAPVMPQRRYDPPEPLSDAAFALVRGMYVYDRTRPLDARVDRVDDSVPAYRRETVSFRTAYDDERMEVHLLLPREATPPYQSVIWYPGSDVYMHRSSERFSSTYLFDFIPRDGRVVVHPVYKGMYERFEPPSMEPATLRDRMIRWAQDIARTIDYLETREDFDASRIAYYGFSSGGVYGAVFTAVEPRLKASILLGGGLVALPFRPENHPAIFAPRSATPTLMINGVDDFILPYELSQKALFDLLGAPPAAKRLARLEGGHIPTNRLEIIREVLDWLDAHLGPV